MCKQNFVICLLPRYFRLSLCTCVNRSLSLCKYANSLPAFVMYVYYLCLSLLVCEVVACICHCVCINCATCICHCL